MPYRGYFALNGTEIVNSSRVVAHVGATVPDSDLGLLVADDTEDCSLTEVSPGLFAVPDDSVELHPRFWSPPNGSRRYGDGLIEVGDCWGPVTLCGQCRGLITWDDSWHGLQAFIGDPFYRPELAPWYTTRSPESGEFGGVWLLDVEGFGPSTVGRTITEMVGAGAAAGPARDTSRVLKFTALLIACSNAGVEYGLQWLSCQLRDTNDKTDSVLRYLAAHPGGSNVDPANLLREVHGVVLTKSPEIGDQLIVGGGRNQQASIYKVSWEMTQLHPYAYLPPVNFPVQWDEIEVQPIKWVHAAECKKSSTCEPMPVLFSTECIPEEIKLVSSPPPSCGGCMPVCELHTYRYTVPTMSYPFECSETAATITIRNTGIHPLSLQSYWQICNTDVDCEDNRWPLQVSGLPPSATLVLDAISGRFHALYDVNRKHRPLGIVGTPNGAPWRPPIIDRKTCWEFVIVAPEIAEFDVELSLADRSA